MRGPVKFPFFSDPTLVSPNVSGSLRTFFKSREELRQVAGSAFPVHSADLWKYKYGHGEDPAYGHQDTF